LLLRLGLQAMKLAVLGLTKSANESAGNSNRVGDNFCCGKETIPRSASLHPE